MAKDNPPGWSREQLEQKSSKELLVIFKKEDHAIAFEVLYQREWKPVMWKLRKMGFQPCDCEDITQNTFVKIAELSLEKIDEVRKLQPYMVQTAYYAGLDYKARRKPETSTDEFDPEQASISPEEAMAFLNIEDSRLFTQVMNQVNLLKPSQRDSFLMLLQGMSYGEIALALESTVPKVRMYIYRARKNLQQFVAGLDKS